MALMRCRATAADYRKHEAGCHASVTAVHPCQASRPARSGASQLHAPLQLQCMQLRLLLVPEPRYRAAPHLAANLAGQVVASQAQVAGGVDAVALEAVAAVVALKVIAGLGWEPGGLDNNRHACCRGRSCHRGSPALAPRVVQGIGLWEGSEWRVCAGRPVAWRAWAWRRRWRHRPPHPLGGAAPCAWRCPGTHRLSPPWLRGAWEAAGGRGWVAARSGPKAPPGTPPPAQLGIHNNHLHAEHGVPVARRPSSSARARPRIAPLLALPRAF